MTKKKNKKYKKTKKFPTKFLEKDLIEILSGLTSLSVYSFTKRNNNAEFNTLLPLLPKNYVTKLGDKLEAIDLIYSGSATSPFLLTLAVGRNDLYENKEHFDIDVFNIAPDTYTTSSYFLNQWHHFRDENGNRTSYEIAPLQISDDLTRKNLTYSAFLTGSTSYYSFEDYEKDKPAFFKIHSKSFGDLNL